MHFAIEHRGPLRSSMYCLDAVGSTRSLNGLFVRYGSVSLVMQVQLVSDRVAVLAHISLEFRRSFSVLFRLKSSRNQTRLQ